MTLLNDICRCAGILLDAHGGYTACDRRRTCARYVHRHRIGPRTSVSQGLCQPFDGQPQDHYLPEEPDHDRP